MNQAQNIDYALGQNIKALRESKGLTQMEAAARISPPVSFQSWQNWEKGKGLTQVRLKQIADIFGVSIIDVQGANGAVVAEYPKPSVRRPPSGKVAVYGFVAASGEYVSLSEHDVLRYVDRHPNQPDNRDCGASEVISESMWPRYKPRELAFWIAKLHPPRGDDVVVEMNDGTSLLKEYNSMKDGMLWLKELYPEERLISVPLDQVKHLHAVVGRG